MTLHISTVGKRHRTAGQARVKRAEGHQERDIAWFGSSGLDSSPLAGFIVASTRNSSTASCRLGPANSAPVMSGSCTPIQAKCAAALAHDGAVEVAL